MNYTFFSLILKDMDENQEWKIPGKRNINEKGDIVSEKCEINLEVSDTDDEFHGLILVIHPYSAFNKVLKFVYLKTGSVKCKICKSGC